MVRWPLEGAAASETLIDRVAEYPSDEQEFCGLYGYNDTYAQAQYLADSNKFFLFASEFKGQHRIFLQDTSTKEVKMLRIPNVTPANLRHGDYGLMRVFEDTLIVSFAATNQTPQVYCIRFK